MTNSNTNYESLTDRNIAEEGDKQYLEYRKQWHENPETFTVAPFPLFLDVEATSACNLKCGHCIQSHAGFEKGYMDFGLYKGIIDEAADNGCYGLKYHTIGRGEPLLHRDLPKMVAYAKKRGLIDVCLNTNATLLNEKKTWDMLDAGLDRISFSIDGFTRDEYEKNRPGAGFDAVLRNVVWFVIERDRGHYPTKIRIQTVDLPGIDLDGYAEFWKPWADEIGVVKYKNMVGRKYDLEGGWKCPQIYQRMSVLYDGTLIPCNHDDRLLAVLGNVKEMSIKRAWKSMKMENIRICHRNGCAEKIGACRGCFLRTSELMREKENDPS